MVLVPEELLSEEGGIMNVTPEGLVIGEVTRTPDTGPVAVGMRP